MLTKLHYDLAIQCVKKAIAMVPESGAVMNNAAHGCPGGYLNLAGELLGKSLGRAFNSVEAVTSYLDSESAKLDAGLGAAVCRMYVMNPTSSI